MGIKFTHGHEVYPLLNSKNRAAHTARPIKIIGGVSTSSCLFIEFQKEMGAFLPHCLELPPRHRIQPPPIRAQCLRWTLPGGVPLWSSRGVEAVTLLWEGKNVSPEESKIVSRPEGASHCDSSHSWTGWHPQRHLSFIFFQRRKRELAFSRLLQRCLFST